MQPLACLPILGTRVASVNYDEAVAAILAAAAAPQAHSYVCVVNVHSVSMARLDERYRRVLNGALMAVPDGAPLIWAHWLLRGRRLRERVYGPALTLRLCEAAAAQDVPVYFYGGKPAVVAALAERMARRFPGLKIAGAFSPPFGERESGDPQLQRELAEINSSGARLVFVGLGAPKQEYFMARHADTINAVQIGVGAAFDFHAGCVPQAPAWMQGMGLEWLFRLCCEPRRLWRRYVYYNPYFAVRLGLQWLGCDRPSRELARLEETVRESHAP